MTLFSAVGALVAEVPVEPGADQARDWLVDELGKPPYQAARPTWFDRLSQGFSDWLDSLRVPDGSGLSGLVPLVVVIVIVALIVVAFIVFGRPRVNRRSRVATGALFGADDSRSAAELRASAQRAAAEGDFDLAVEEAFRALARQLTERTIVLTAPGTTAVDFAHRAGVAFPDASAELSGCARLFDGVRYLGQSAARGDYDRIAALDRHLQASRPVALDHLPGELIS